MSQLRLDAVTSSLLGVFEGSAADPDNRHVKELRFQFTLLVVQKSGVLLFPEDQMIIMSVFSCVPPANSVETLSKCEITQVLVLPTSVVTLIMDSAAGTVGCKFQCLLNQNICKS